MQAEILGNWRATLRGSLAFAWLVVACQPLPRAATQSAPLPTAPSAVPTPSTAPVVTVPAPLAPVSAPVSARCIECEDGRLNLREGWQLQASAKVKDEGKGLSTPGYSASGWYPTSVPKTVLAALVDNGVYPNPYLGNQAPAIPSAPFAGSYWYRTEFEVPADFAGQASWLNLEGINYRANLWLNGQLLASSKDLVGTFTTREWNVARLLRPGQRNALAIEVFPPDLKRDLALTWLDWNRTPPDRNMGVWRDVYLKKSGAVAVQGVRVLSKVDTETLASAELTIKVELQNTADRPLQTEVSAELASAGGTNDAPISVTQSLLLAAGETKIAIFDATSHPSLRISKPRLWWPAQLGAPNLYDARISARAEGRISDRLPVRFGIRQVSFEPTASGARLFRINGKPILIRGAAWASDMLLRHDAARVEKELALVRDLGLNAIRLEGKLESDDFYAKTDAYGILAIPGWMCCDAWQASKRWNEEQRRVAIASTASQARRLRNHPSVIDFLIGSDEAPAPLVERELLDALAREDWSVPVSPSASDRTTKLEGRSGMKMTGPYDWVPPLYWYQDRKHGGAFGFNSETCPGPAIPELETLRAWLAPDELDALWSKPRARLLHAGTPGERFDNLGAFNRALSKRHGPATSLEDYVRKAQLMNYEAERAMFEAYSRQKYASATGIVQWLLNSAWPSLIWHLYGHDLSTAGSYFGAKKANEAVHVQYSYDDRSVVVVNQTPDALTGLTVTVRVYDSESRERYALDFPVNSAADSAVRVMALPEIAPLSRNYFVKLGLSKGSVVLSHNFYWLSQKPDVSDYARTDWSYTPTSDYADFTDLARLPPATLTAVVSTDAAGVRRIEVRNTSSVIAWFVRLDLGHAATSLPVLWQDNYFSLTPGERRSIELRAAADGASPFEIGVSAMNVARTLASEARP